MAILAKQGQIAGIGAEGADLKRDNVVDVKAVSGPVDSPMIQAATLTLRVGALPHSFASELPCVGGVESLPFGRQSALKARMVGADPPLKNMLPIAE